MNDAGVRWLEGWFARQCNGSWEHDHGIDITSSDNPGWVVKIELGGTELEAKARTNVVLRDRENVRGSEGGLPPTSWLDCAIASGQFVGAGGAADLNSILEVFREWALDSH